jgi:hypothetical protein
MMRTVNQRPSRGGTMAFAEKTSELQHLHGHHRRELRVFELGDEVGDGAAMRRFGISLMMLRRLRP